jgi:hypothetical protein
MNMKSVKPKARAAAETIRLRVIVYPPASLPADMTLRNVTAKRLLLPLQGIKLLLIPAPDKLDPAIRLTMDENGHLQYVREAVVEGGAAFGAYHASSPTSLMHSSGLKW